MLNRVTTSLNDNRLFNITHNWCANDSSPQNISLNFTELIYLTRLRVRGSSFSFRILVNASKTIYSDINGVDVSINNQLANAVTIAARLYLGVQCISQYCNNTTMANC